MSNDLLIAQLRADLDAFTSTVSHTPPSLQMPAASPSPRRWIAIGAAAACVVGLVAALTFVDAGPRQSASSIPPTATSAPPPATTPLPDAQPKPVPPTPEGWVVVEWGDLRLSVPPDMSPFADAGACTYDQHRLNCEAVGFSIQPDIDPGFISTDFDVVVNGLAQTRIGEGDGVTVRDFRIDVFFSGVDDSTAWAIADTIGVSSKWRAAAEEPAEPPSDWQEIDYRGALLAVPPEWPIEELSPDVADPDRCGFRGIPHGVTLGRGSLDTSTVRCASPPVLVAPSDGIRVFEVDPSEVESHRLDDHPGYPIVETILTKPDGTTFIVRQSFGVDASVGLPVQRSIGIRVDVAPGVATVPGLAPVPTTALAPSVAASGEYETVGTVIQFDGELATFCVPDIAGQAEGACGILELAGWDWAMVDTERIEDGTVIADHVYVRGLWGEAPQNRLTVIEARVATADEQTRLTPRQTLRVTNDPWISADDLRASLERVRASVDVPPFLFAVSVSDASGEWIEVMTIPPSPPDLQAQLDAEFGLGVVRVSHALTPVE